MFYLLRFYPGSKIPQALSSYTEKFYCWTTAPNQALIFRTESGAEATIVDINQHSAMAKKYRFIVASVSKVPTGHYSGADTQGFLAWQKI